LDDNFAQMTFLNTMGVDWVEIPSGRLVRGTPERDVDAIAVEHGVQRAWISKEAPRAELVMRGFAIGRTPVTVAQWQQFALETHGGRRFSLGAGRGLMSCSDSTAQHSSTQVD
jgi:formylglycine-generating enzyme required for sulfatase activity